MANNQEIIVWVRPDQKDEIRPGDEVVTTTSEFDFNSLEGCFDQEAKEGVIVFAEHIGEDYTEYEQKKSNNGGCYGFDYWKVVEVLE